MFISLITPIASGGVWWLFAKPSRVDIILDLPREVRDEEHFVLIVRSSEMEFRSQDALDRILIPLTNDGHAQIPGPVFERWHRLFVATPTQTYQASDFAVTNKFVSAMTTVRLPRGGVQSISVVDGSRYEIRIAFDKNPEKKKGNKSNCQES